jgi:hypothetical protein
MVIGAHIWGEDIEQSLLLNALKKTALLQPENKIILFANVPLTNLPQNCLQVTINPKPKNKLLLYYWFTYKLPKLLLKYNISSFISNAGMLASGFSLNQFLFIEHKELLDERNSFFKKRLNNAVAIALTIFVTDEVIADNLRKKFPTHLSKIQQLNFSSNENNVPFTLHEIETIKEKYAEGFDYFLFPVNASSKIHIITLLKSFSQLKKWQKTSLKMILLFENETDEKLLPDFKNYKYKNEVVLLRETKDNVLQLTAAAFSFIFFDDYKNKVNVNNALHYNIPVIAADTPTNNLLYQSAVSYTAATVDGLALQLQLIYKNEIYKNQLLQQANIYLTQFDSHAASQKFAEAVSN